MLPFKNSNQYDFLLEKATYIMNIPIRIKTIWGNTANIIPGIICNSAKSHKTP